MEQYEDIISVLEELNETKYANLTDLKLIDQVLEKLDKGIGFFYEIIQGFCEVKKEGYHTFSDITKWIEESGFLDDSYMYLNFDPEGNYIPDEEYELYWKNYMSEEDYKLCCLYMESKK